MKFSSYIVRLKHQEPSLTGSLLLSGTPLTADFQKIDTDLYIVQFKTQLQLNYRQKIDFKNKDIQFEVLLPVISKYNKRKLGKLAKILSPQDTENVDLLLSLAGIDKFVKINELLPFFSIDRETIVPILLTKELAKEFKLIDLCSLTITSYENYQNYLQQLDALFTECYTTVRTLTLKFSEIEAKIKLPMSSLFFKYLVRIFKKNFSFKVKKDKIVFQKVAISEDTKESMVEIEEILKTNKLVIFSIANILKLSEVLVQKAVNDTLWQLVDKGEVVRLNDEYFIFSEDLNKITNRLKTYKRNQGEMIDIKTFRDFTHFSRKYIIILFEYFDSEKITERMENQRRILLGV